MTAVPPTDQDLSSLLHAVQDGDDADALLDNGAIANLLGLSLETVAEQLAEAKDRSLVWGIRNGQRPAPWFTDLEVTVQGRRFLSNHPPG
jgi:hypothetical protein